MRNFLLALTLATGAFAVHAADMPVPKVMSDAPTDKGAWRMEMLDMPPAQAEQMKMMGGGMTVCQTAGEAMAREQGPQKNQCTSKLIEDTAARAVVEVQCAGNPPTTTRSTITRAGPKAYLAEVQTGTPGKMQTMKMRMSHVGPCSATDSVMKMDKDSPACQQMRAQMGGMDPATQCKGAGREQCVKALTDARARMQGMCQ